MAFSMACVGAQPAHPHAQWANININSCQAYLVQSPGLSNCLAMIMLLSCAEGTCMLLARPAEQQQRPGTRILGVSFSSHVSAGLVQRTMLLVHDV